MVNLHSTSAKQMDAVFSALADPTRRDMVSRLSHGSRSVGELGEPYEMTKPAVTKHVKVLERAGLVRREKDGRVHRLTLQPEPLERAQSWIEHHRTFWEASLDALADYVESVAQVTDPRAGDPT